MTGQARIDGGRRRVPPASFFGSPPPTPALVPPRPRPRRRRCPALRGEVKRPGLAALSSDDDRERFLLAADQRVDLLPGEQPAEWVVRTRPVDVDLVVAHQCLPPESKVVQKEWYCGYLDE